MHKASEIEIEWASEQVAATTQAQTHTHTHTNLHEHARTKIHMSICGLLRPTMRKRIMHMVMQKCVQHWKLYHENTCCFRVLFKTQPLSDCMLYSLCIAWSSSLHLIYLYVCMFMQLCMHSMNEFSKHTIELKLPHIQRRNNIEKKQQQQQMHFIAQVFG